MQRVIGRYSRRILFVCFAPGSRSFSMSSVNLQSPTTNDLRFDFSVDEINKQTDHIMEKTKQVLDEVVKVQGPRTFENTILPMALCDGDLAAKESSVDFLQYVSTDKAQRDASSEASTKLGDFAVECGMRLDVYKALCEFRDSVSLDSFTPIDRRLIERTIRDFERNGLALDEEPRNRLKALKQEISRMQIEFQKNLNEDDTKLVFTKDELEGLPEDFLKGLKAGENEGEYVVTLQYPDLVPVLKLAKKESTRKKLDHAHASKCQESNTPLLEKTLQLRREQAKLLGYKNHADFILEIRMAKSSANVLEFERALFEKLQEHKEKETTEWLRLKKQEKESRGEEFDNKIHSYDWSYYHRTNMELNFQVNDQEIKNYFPMEIVTDGMLKVYEEILSLKFNEIQSPTVWHESVRMFAVHDEASKDFIGHFYLDLYPREGKYGHAAAFPLLPRYVKKDGSIQHPVSAMVANFTKPTADQPSLLKFNEVETYFHEFGHVMHGICTQSPYARFSGTSVERDFVEAPSQMLENWCYESEVLRRLSGHYQNNSKKLPEDMLESLIKARNADTGLMNSRQIFFGMFDQTIHSTEEENIDTGALYDEFRQKYTGVACPPGTNGSAGFGHLMGGYDAQYYGYLYSQVFSADMFAQFKQSKDGVLSKEVGRRYRDSILAPGGTRDSMESIVEFLGREPKQEPFLVSIGVAKE